MPDDGPLYRGRHAPDVLRLDSRRACDRWCDAGGAGSGRRCRSPWPSRCSSRCR